jgi:ATP synthase protein I
LSQLIVMCIGLPITYLLAGAQSTVSLFSGAACAAVPQAYFALRMTLAARHSAQQAARQGLAAEAGKFLLSAIGFALVFAVLKPPEPGLVFVGFAVLWVVQIVDGIRLLTRPAR